MASGLKRNDETDDEAYERVKKSKYITDFKYDEDAPFIVWNTSCGRSSCGSTRRTPSLRPSTNPWRKLPSGLPTCGLPARRMNVTLDTELVKSCADAVVTLELMLLSLARTQSEMTWNDQEGTTQRMLDKLRRQWSLNLMTQLSVR